MPSPRYKSVLLVDGYNVIGAWCCLQKTRDLHGLEASRNELIETMVNYSAFKDLETQIVFDAHYRYSNSNSESVTENLTVFYTDFGETADTYIEKYCASFRRRQPPGVSRKHRLIVATSDNAQRLTVVGYGAEWMSAQQLEDEVVLTTHHIGKKQKQNKQNPSRFLFNSLDAKSQQMLSELRKGLK
jgi:uncharacterized protein